MEDKLKRNIVKTGIFMLIAAVIPLLFPLTFMLPAETGFPAILIFQILYWGGCFFVLLCGSSQVVWELPCRKSFRTLIFLAWLILYPALCLGWYFLYGMCFFLIFHVHW